MTSESARRRFRDIVAAAPRRRLRARQMAFRQPGGRGGHRAGCGDAGSRRAGSRPVANARAWFLSIVRNTALTWMARNRPEALSFIGDFDDLDLIETREFDASAERGAGHDRRAAAESVRARSRTALAASRDAGHARHQRTQLSRDRRGHRRADGHCHVPAVARRARRSCKPWKPRDERAERNLEIRACASTPRSTASSTPRTP